MTNIRKYAKKIGFEVVGKLHKVCNLNKSTRFYLDEAKNQYFVDIINETVEIIPKDRKETKQ